MCSLVTKSRAIVPCLSSVNINEVILCLDECCVSWAPAQPFPMNGSVTRGGAVATNINMQYNETNQQYFCIVILISQQWSVPAFRFMARCVMIVPTFWCLQARTTLALGATSRYYKIYLEILHSTTKPYKPDILCMPGIIRHISLYDLIRLNWQLADSLQ